MAIAGLFDESSGRRFTVICLLRLGDHPNRKAGHGARKGHKIINHHGTAPGAWFEQEGPLCCPDAGVPSEMKAMWNESVRPADEAPELAPLSLCGAGRREQPGISGADLLENAQPDCCHSLQDRRVRSADVEGEKCAGICQKVLRSGWAMRQMRMGSPGWRRHWCAP